MSKRYKTDSLIPIVVTVVVHDWVRGFWTLDEASLTRVAMLFGVDPDHVVVSVDLLTAEPDSIHDTRSGKTLCTLLPHHDAPDGRGCPKCGGTVSFIRTALMCPTCGVVGGF
jgi:hypothetical protein